MPELITRHAHALVDEALAATRVVLVNGARQAGKSTLTRLATAGRPGTTTRLLDDPATLRAAQDDPTGFVDHDGLMDRRDPAGPRAVELWPFSQGEMSHFKRIC